MALCSRNGGYCTVPADFCTDLPEMIVPAWTGESSAEALSVSRTSTLAVAPVESITVTRAKPGPLGVKNRVPRGCGGSGLDTETQLRPFSGRDMTKITSAVKFARAHVASNHLWGANRICASRIPANGL